MSRRRAPPIAIVAACAFQEPEPPSNARVVDRAPEVDVGIVLPGEPDPAEHLDAVLGRVEERLDRERGRGRCGERAGIVVSDGAGGIPHRGARELGAGQHVGAAVLRALELADRSAELAAIGRVLRGGVDTPLRRADRVGSEHDRREVADLGSRDLAQLTGRRDRRAVDRDLRNSAGEVHALQLDRGEVARFEHDPRTSGVGDHQVGEMTRQHGPERARHRQTSVALLLTGEGSPECDRRDVRTIGEAGGIRRGDFLSRGLEHRGAQDRGQERPGRHDPSQFLEDDDELGQPVARTAVDLVDVQAEPPLLGEPVPELGATLGVGVEPRPGHGRRTRPLGPPPHRHSQGVVFLGDPNRHAQDTS